MKCSQCTTELPATATACPQCGARVTPSISQNQERSSVRYSYLPAGAPPWPTTVPAVLPYVVEGSATRPQAPSVYIPPRPVEPSTKTNIPLAILMVLLVPILGSLLIFGLNALNKPVQHRATTTSNDTGLPTAPAATATATTGTGTLPEPAAFKDGSDQTVNVSLKYPSDWSFGPADKSSTDFTGLPILQPDHLIVMEIERFTADGTAKISSPDALNQGLVQEITQKYPNTKKITPSNPNPTIGNTQWTQQDATITLTSGTTLHWISLSTLHNQNYYNIQWSVPTDLYQTALDKYMQPILNSIQFLS